MKSFRLLLVFALLCSILIVNAQQGINYKAIINNAEGSALINTAVTIQFTILENGTTDVYQETHSTTTDANGIVIVYIGEGTIVSGNFSIIDWGSNPHFLKTEIDKGDGLIDMGTTEFKAVPYAYHSETTTNVDDADADPENELISDFWLEGKTLKITNSTNIFSVDLSSLVSENSGAYYFRDKDDDGFGDSFNPVYVPNSISAPVGFVVDNTDCDDNNETVYPGATEIYGDGVDNNCDGEVDEYSHPELDYSGRWRLDYFRDLQSCGINEEIFYFIINQNEAAVALTLPGFSPVLTGGMLDGYHMTVAGYRSISSLSIQISGEFTDLDHFSGTVTIYSSCNINGSFSITAFRTDDIDQDGYTLAGGDCNDYDVNVYPEATEIFGDGVDNNCNGEVDEYLYPELDYTGRWRLDYFRDLQSCGINEEIFYFIINQNEAAVALTLPGFSPVLTGFVGDGYHMTVAGYRSISSLSIQISGEFTDLDHFSGTVTIYSSCNINGSFSITAFRTDDIDQDGNTLAGGDCNDYDSNIHPEAIEICGDGIDQDCDGEDLLCPYSHTINIDGINDFTSEEQFIATSGNSYYISWDDNFIYFGINDLIQNPLDYVICMIYIGGLEEESTRAGYTLYDQTPSLPMDCAYCIEWLPTHNYSLYKYDLISGWLDYDVGIQSIGSDYFAEIRIPLKDFGNPDHLDIHISRVRYGWTWDGIPTNSFPDSYDPDYTTFYRFDFNSPMSPSSYAVLSESD